MDDLGFNKIAGAVLAVGLGFMALTKLPGVVMGGGGEEIAYKVGSIDTGGSDEVEIEQPFPQAEWVAAMDDTKGAKVFKKCKSCHNVDSGGPNGTGPGLYGVVDNAVASHAGFSYSAAMSGMGGTWTYEELDDFLLKPSAHTPGTKMNFVGLKKAEDRAAVIEHLRLADASPSPRPTAKAPITADEAAPEGEDMAEAPAGEASTPAPENGAEATEAPAETAQETPNETSAETVTEALDTEATVPGTENEISQDDVPE